MWGSEMGNWLASKRSYRSGRVPLSYSADQEDYHPRAIQSGSCGFSVPIVVLVGPCPG